MKGATVIAVVYLLWMMALAVVLKAVYDSYVRGDTSHSVMRARTILIVVAMVVTTWALIIWGVVTLVGHALSDDTCLPIEVGMQYDGNTNTWTYADGTYYGVSESEDSCITY